MTNKMQKALIASVGAVALMFATSETFARSGGAQGAGVAASRAIAGGHAFRQHRRNFIGPAVGGYYYGADGAPIMDAAPPPVSNDVHYTYTYDVPWDWAHRFPPNVVPSDRPYVPGCGSETVTVPGRNGDQTINITRCY
jgi:hypothetical protein